MDIQASWRQVRTLTSASIRARYRNTFAGLLWVVLSPLLMYGAQGYVFRVVLKINFENYPLFLLTGLMPWIFFSASVNQGTTLFLAHGRLLKSFPIHPLVLLVSLILDNLVNFVVTFLLILVPLAIFTNGVYARNFLLLPLPLLSLMVATLSTAWFLANLQVSFHDTRYIVDFALSIGYFLTPIFYPVQFVGPDGMWLVRFNPLAHLLAPLQALSHSALPDDFTSLVVKSYLVSAVITCAAVGLWVRRRNLVYFYL